MDSNIERTEGKPVLTIPIAILIAGAIIAGAVIWTNGKGNTEIGTKENPAPGQVISDIRKVDDTDYIMGNPDADIVIIEYSDASCPFCKLFHSTMNRIMQEYGKTGRVAWVYRHFPLDSIHPNARKEGEAMECAGELGGNEAFWAYTNELYNITPSVTQSSPKGLDPLELPKIAEQIGLNVQSFNSCLNSGKYADKVQNHFTEGRNAGVLGTPYSFMIRKGGDTPIPLNGAQPYNDVKTAIDAILSSI
jgi:protein-disulfide isomerase